MDEQKFNQFWKIIIQNAMSELKGQNPNIISDTDVKKKLWNIYLQGRHTLHDILTNPDGLLDRHKVGALMAYSIYRVQPLELKAHPASEPNEEMNLYGYFCNEILALKCALSTVLSFIFSKAHEDKNEIQIQCFQDGFSFPECEHAWVFEKKFC